LEVRGDDEDGNSSSDIAAAAAAATAPQQHRQRQRQDDEARLQVQPAMELQEPLRLRGHPPVEEHPLLP